MRCPLCSSRAVGKVGIEHYYCWDCFIEYQYRDNKAKLYIVEEDGSLAEL